MRFIKCYNIKVHAEIPIHTFIDQTGESPYLYFRDGNLNSYSIQTVCEACEKASNLPIIKRDNLGLGKIVGFAQSIKWNQNGYIELDGLLMSGEINEIAEFGVGKHIVSMELCDAVI